jgi:nucleolar protein 12
MGEGGVELDSSTIKSATTQGQKRKRKNKDDDIEERYMKKLALEEAEENAKATEENGLEEDKEEEQEDGPESQSTVESEDEDQDELDDEETYNIPQHETLSQAFKSDEIEKASRTVFLGNVTTDAIKSKSSKKSLMEHLSSFFSDLPNPKEHKIDSLRFRSTAFADASIPKKAAFAKKIIMDTTTHSTNAYVVYNTTSAARESVKRLNGTIILDRHLRVDSVAHPSKVDHRRCVFVGNLGFVDDDTKIKEAEQEELGRKKSKPKPPADIEEGLWRKFAEVGEVESVRVVRDRGTRVGKGIAYVQFKVRFCYSSPFLY